MSLARCLSGHGAVLQLVAAFLLAKIGGEGVRFCSKKKGKVIVFLCQVFNDFATFFYGMARLISSLLFKPSNRLNNSWRVKPFMASLNSFSLYFGVNLA